MIVKLSFGFLEENEEISDELYESKHDLGDGVFFSENPPVVLGDCGQEEVEFDTEKDFISKPYETYTMFVWKGEKPVKIDDYKGQGNYGSALSFKVDKPGYITICFEDD